MKKHGFFYEEGAAALRSVPPPLYKVRTGFGRNDITGRGYNPSVFLLQRSKKPAPLAQGSRGSPAIAAAKAAFFKESFSTFS